MVRGAARAALALCSLLGARAQDAETNGDGEVNGDTMTQAYQLVEYDVTATTGLPPDGFVTVGGNKFFINGCDFVFSGINMWQAPELASNTQVGRGNPDPGREHLTNVFNEVAKSQMKVIRLWAHPVTAGRALWLEPGVADEEIFQGLDFINDEARKRGLKLIYNFADNWYDVGGVPQYASWGGGDFFSEGGVSAYKKSVSALLNRKNTINGITYKDDATIMAWNLANELRATGRAPGVMQGWIEDVCGFVKSIDGSHLVGIGQEGFSSDLFDDANPAPWAAQEGQDFVSNHAASCIDYVGFHVWPDNWDLVTTEFQQNYIRSRIEQADANIGKPIILEEFGKIGDPGTKDPYIKSAFDVVDESIAAGSGLRGTLVYHLYDEGIGPGKYGIWASMSTFGLVREHAAKMQALSGCS